MQLTQSAQAQVPQQPRAASLQGAAGAPQERGSPPAHPAAQVSYSHPAAASDVQHLHSFRPGRLPDVRDIQIGWG